MNDASIRRRRKQMHKITMAVVDRINAGNRQEERELTALLAPIDRRLTVDIFNKGMFEYEARVGRDGSVTHQPGVGFLFGVNPGNCRPYVGGEELCVDFEDSPDWAMEWMRHALAKKLWNYFYGRTDRVLAYVR